MAHAADAGPGGDAHAGDAHAGHSHSDSPTEHNHAEPGHANHGHDYREAGRRRLLIALALIASYLVVEVVAGVLSGSLALLADAAHMLTDAGAIGLALFAIWISNRPASIKRTFGYYRTEVLAALFNAVSLWVMAGWIFFEAYHRFREVPEVAGGVVLIAGGVGLVVNLVAAWILHRSAGHSLNVEGAFRHVLADLLGSVGVMLSGGLTLAFGWWIADPILSVIIGVLILISSWRLVVNVFHVLLEGAPARIDMHRLCMALENVDGVTLVHDIHAWTITSGYESLTAHVLVDPDYPDELENLRRRLQQVAYHDFGIAHITLQMEQSLEGCTERHHFDHLLA